MEYWDVQTTTLHAHLLFLSKYFLKVMLLETCFCNTSRFNKIELKSYCFLTSGNKY